MSETLHSIMQSNKFTLCRRLGVERIKPVPLNYELVPLCTALLRPHISINSKILAQFL